MQRVSNKMKKKKFLVLIKNLSTDRTPTELKQNLALIFFVNFFVSFVKL